MSSKRRFEHSRSQHDKVFHKHRHELPHYKQRQGQPYYKHQQRQPYYKHQQEQPYYKLLQDKPHAKRRRTKPPKKPFRSFLQVFKPTKNIAIRDIVFDLEFNDGNPEINEITEIAATSRDGQAEFDAYILPQQRISPFVAKKTGFKIGMMDGKRRLFVRGQVVDTVTLAEAMKGFINFLNVQCGASGKINLMGHSVITNDFPFLYRALVKTLRLTQFRSMVSSFTDTLFLFQDAKPDRQKYSQKELINDYVPGYEYTAHTALADSKALAVLLEATDIDKAYYQGSTYTYESIEATLKNP